MSNPRTRFILIAAALAGPAAAFLWATVPLLDLLQAWLVAMTAVTFLFYGYDKLVAGTSWPRVPEHTLLTLALAGGTFGALAGMRFFRHKTRQRPFQLKLVLVMAVQLALLGAYYSFIQPALAAGA